MHGGFSVCVLYKPFLEGELNSLRLPAPPPQPKALARSFSLLWPPQIFNLYPSKIHLFLVASEIQLGHLPWLFQTEDVSLSC